MAEEDIFMGTLSRHLAPAGKERDQLDIVLWRDISPPGHCKLASPYLWSTVKLHAGISVADEYPGGLNYPMSDFLPDDILLSDNFKVAGQILVSGKLKAHLLAALPDHPLEFLPVSILNHKGRVVSADYFILHPLGVHDCIDLQRSKVKWNPLKKKVITSCKGLVFKPDSLPPGLKLFRPEYWGFNIMATRAFGDELIAAGFSGLRFIDAAGFDGIE
jgi:hypothetical protein